MFGKESRRTTHSLGASAAQDQRAAVGVGHGLSVGQVARYVERTVVDQVTAALVRKSGVYVQRSARADAQRSAVVKDLRWYCVAQQQQPK